MYVLCCVMLYGVYGRVRVGADGGSALRVYAPCKQGYLFQLRRRHHTHNNVNHSLLLNMLCAQCMRVGGT